MWYHWIANSIPFKIHPTCNNRKSIVKTLARKPYHAPYFPEYRSNSWGACRCFAKSRECEWVNIDNSTLAVELLMFLTSANTGWMPRWMSCDLWGEHWIDYRAVQCWWRLLNNTFTVETPKFVSSYRLQSVGTGWDLLTGRDLQPLTHRTS